MRVPPGSNAGVAVRAPALRATPYPSLTRTCYPRSAMDAGRVTARVTANRAQTARTPHYQTANDPAGGETSRVVDQGIARGLLEPIHDLEKLAAQGRGGRVAHGLLDRARTALGEATVTDSVQQS